MAGRGRMSPMGQRSMRERSVFGRRRRREADELGPGEADFEDLDENEELDRDWEQPHPGRESGPWDIGEQVPEQERIDFGSLQVPTGGGVEVQVSVAEGQAAWITVIHGDASLQLQAFAAPKSSGLWDEVRQEISAEVAKAGGRSEEAEGPFGVELRARITPPEPTPGSRPGTLEPIRFLGVDGPRWFLRGVISGSAARHPERAAPLERVFEGVVVNRGSHPVPPRDLLEIRLPDQARQALTDYMGEGEDALNPFHRGPEITETR